LHTGAKAAFAGYTAQRSLAPQGLRQDGSTIPLTLLQSPGSLPLMAVAGIAQPGNFFSLLQASGLVVAKTLALPDHYDFDSFSRSIYEGYQLICTEKDAAKLWAQVPSAIAVALVQSAEPAFFSHLDSCLTAC
jgi:tetraacyldisaccharide 4'-kinase